MQRFPFHASSISSFTGSHRKRRSRLKRWVDWDRTIDSSDSTGLRTCGSQSTGVEGRTILYIGFKSLEQTSAFFPAFTKDMGGGAHIGGAWWHTDHHKEAAP